MAAWAERGSAGERHGCAGEDPDDDRRAARGASRDGRGRAARLEIEELEAEHLAAEDAYLRRRDRLLGREVQQSYVEIESARALLHRAKAERQRRFERRRMAVLAGHGLGAGFPPSQLDLLPGE